EGEIGILIGAFGVASLLSRFIAGYLLRMQSERRIMLWGAVLFFCVYLSFTIFKPLWPFLVSRLLQGLAFACFDTAAIAYVIRIIPSENRSRAISYFLVASPLSSALVASVSVFILNQYGFTFLVLGCTGLSICTFLFCTRLKAEGTARQIESLSSGGTLFFERRIVAPAIFSFLFSFTWGGLLAFFPLYSISCGVTNPGWFFTSMAAVLILARLTGGSILDTWRKETILSLAILTSAAALLVLMYSSSLLMFVLVGMLWGIGAGIIPPVSMAYALEYSGTSDGTAVGTYQGFMDLGFGLGPIITGMIVPITGYRMMYLCLACVCLADLGYFQFYLNKRKTQRNVR
ncbi:MAG TPA: MFS transporter, partial [Syntrophorhabdaceae bacterium]|nr:MFS transporter [Syntrophorhabdaceae bacterium]